MALLAKILKKQKLSYRNGYDITVEFDDDGTKYTKTFYFESKTEPTDKKLENRIAHIQSNVQNDIDNPPVPEKTESEIIDILIEKGLLTEGQTIDDLKTKREIEKGGVK